ncbi:integrase core domain-containing protein [Nonomuraea fuscirosea]|uniref:integrase core domain-containing protein n=1 Tax=Nonomuraea fuscirosea TaxID=1291556 RepID=UPI00343C9DEE
MSQSGPLPRSRTGRPPDRTGSRDGPLASPSGPLISRPASLASAPAKLLVIFSGNRAFVKACQPCRIGPILPIARQHPGREEEYTAARHQELCRRLGVIQSMGRVGCALDNAAAEAFNSTLKVEYVHRHRFRTRAEARLKIATWIADFYNTTRRHSAHEGLPPITFERHMIEKRQASSALLRTTVA